MPTTQGTSATLSFNENSRGWTSFKSFIQESGLSLNNSYYTFKNGHLYEHHINPVRNEYYGDDYNSHVEVLFNEQPGSVKSFNTLNYEGSQARNTPDTTNDVEYYNNFLKAGWYVQQIFTNLQNGTSLEFLSKEGKWFAKVKGETTEWLDDGKAGNIDTREFSFQGIGNSTTATCPECPDQSWDCVDGSCVDPGTGNGLYQQLSECLTECEPTGPETSWNCIPETPPIIVPGSGGYWDNDTCESRTLVDPNGFPGYLPPFTPQYGMWSTLRNSWVAMSDPSFGYQNTDTTTLKFCIDKTDPSMAAHVASASACDCNNGAGILVSGPMYTIHVYTPPGQTSPYPANGAGNLVDHATNYTTVFNALQAFGFDFIQQANLVMGMNINDMISAMNSAVKSIWNDKYQVAWSPSNPVCVCEGWNEGSPSTTTPGTPCSCVEIQGGGGNYVDENSCLIQCCGDPTQDPWLCTFQGENQSFAGCIQDPNGIYNDETTCIRACQSGPPDRYKCIENVGCVSDPNGIYTSLAACQNECEGVGIQASYDCRQTNYGAECYDPGTGNGQFSDYTSCINSIIGGDQCPDPPPLNGPIFGCTSPLATNYNPLATIDDNSCEFPCPMLTHYVDTQDWITASTQPMNANTTLTNTENFLIDLGYVPNNETAIDILVFKYGIDWDMRLVRSALYHSGSVQAIIGDPCSSEADPLCHTCPGNTNNAQGNPTWEAMTWRYNFAIRHEDIDGYLGYNRYYHTWRDYIDTALSCINSNGQQIVPTNQLIDVTKIGQNAPGWDNVNGYKTGTSQTNHIIYDSFRDRGDGPNNGNYCTRTPSERAYCDRTFSNNCECGN